MSRILPRFDFRVDLASESATGRVRQSNQDAMLVAPELALLGLADGMGGLDAGEDASRIALDCARAHLATKEATRTVEEFAAAPTLERRRQVFALLRSACEAAHARLVEEQDKRGARMGTTLDLCLLVRDKAFVAHVGDGRVFLVRSRATLQITADHLVHDPSSVRLPGRDGRRGPKPLSSGIGLPAPLRVDVFYVDLRRGDLVLLATDGAYAPLDDEQTLGSVCRGTPRSVADEIVRNSLAKGGRDNASVVVARIEERFLARPGEDAAGQSDVHSLSLSPLLSGLATPSVLAAIAAGIELDVEAGAPLPAFDAGDLCAYLLLDGTVRLADGTVLGPPALLFAESLVGVDKPRRGPVEVATAVRCLRIRRDDFREVCEHDPALGLALYQRLATHLARTT